jgi:hypothetical protein
MLSASPRYSLVGSRLSVNPNELSQPTRYTPPAEPLPVAELELPLLLPPPPPHAASAATAAPTTPRRETSHRVVHSLWRKRSTSFSTALWISARS